MQEWIRAHPGTWVCWPEHTLVHPDVLGFLGVPHPSWQECTRNAPKHAWFLLSEWFSIANSFYFSNSFFMLPSMPLMILWPTDLTQSCWHCHLICHNKQ
jgi:hypothetical protein